MTKIVISYRRHDSDAITGRIFDRLITRYGADSVFRDIDNIPPGLDFRKSIGHALESTDVLLAVVGPQWAGKSADGRTRINEATDLVRIEIELALRRDIPLVPILVGNATMPEPGELPEGLQDFSFRNAVKVDALEDFEDHVKRLIRSLDRLLEARSPSPRETGPPTDKPSEPSPAEVVPSEARGARQATPQAKASPVAEPRRIDAAPTSPPRAPIDEAHAAATPAQGAARQQDHARAVPSFRISPALILPLIAAALSAVLYATGLWDFTMGRSYTPAAHVTLGLLFAWSIWRYGSVSVTRSVVAGAVLCAGSSAIGLAYDAVLLSISAFDFGARLAVQAGDNVAIAALIVAIGAVFGSPLGRWQHWLIALLLWPSVAVLTVWLVHDLSAAAQSSRSAVMFGYFLAFVVRRMVVFASIGYWLSPARRA